MNILQQGGLMMWPLLILSIASFAVVAERFVIFTTRRFPAADSLGELFTLARNGDKEAALDSFKQIYEVDYGYRDVAKRVEESYSS